VRRPSIVVADSHAVFRDGAQSLLLRESEFVVTTVGDLDGLEAVFAETPPDIALVDLDLPPLGGLDAVARLTARGQSHLIVWSFDPDRETVLTAIRAGASGYLSKEISPTGLVRSLHGVLRGEASLARDLVRMLIDALHDVEEREDARNRRAGLSEREREVLGLVAEGAHNREIAVALAISEFTVKRHVQNILQKLELPSRHAAAAFYGAALGDTRITVPGRAG
jgi:DNA-binding NarL/FixJ family response regulator